MKIAEKLIQYIYPLRCPVCDDIVTPYGEKICLECMGKLKLLTPPWCLQCGKKLAGEGELCRDCQSRSHRYVRGRALYEYDSAALGIYRFKYGRRREYAEYFGEQMAEYLGGFVRETGAEALIPIPLHRRRMAARGYNQSELLTEAVGRRLELPVYSRLLVRTKNTKPLKYQNYEERQNNLKKAFNIAENDVKLNTIILIDDIYTTGSTIDEAADALRAAGAERVYFLTLACGAGV